DPRTAGLHFLLGGGGVVPRRLHVDDGLVDAFLLGLDGSAKVLQLLVRVGNRSDERAESVRAARLRDGKAGRGEQHADGKRHRADPRGASHSARVSYGSHANAAGPSWATFNRPKNHS